jgi:hypothetical protein
MAKSAGERQAALRARQKRIDDAEPLLKELRLLLADIRETDDHEKRLISLAIIGEIINGDHGLYEVGHNEHEQLSDETLFAISDCLAFHENVTAQMQKKASEFKEHKKIEEVEPLLNVLLDLLADIKKTGSDKSRLKTLMLIGQVLDSPEYGLLEMDKNQYEQLGDKENMAVTECISFYQEIGGDMKKSHEKSN